MSRAEVLLPAVKRKLVEVGYYVGPVDAGWNDDAERGWAMYCARFGFVHTPVPEIYNQEVAQRDTMLKWYADEEAYQASIGIAPPKPPTPMNIYDIINMYSEEPLPPGIEDEIMEARSAKGVDEEPTDVQQQLDANRRALEEERRRSVRSALKAAKRIVKDNVPEELRAFVVPPEPPREKIKVTKRTVKRIKTAEKTPERQMPLLRVRGGAE